MVIRSCADQYQTKPSSFVCRLVVANGEIT
jgi:hypothetical protein